MKRYNINCHYDMVINVDVIADNEEQALQMAYDRAAGMSMQAAECVGHEECVCRSEELTAEELRRMEREAVQEHVRSYIDWLATDPQLKEDLADIAYRGAMINWAHGVLCIPDGHPREEWLTRLFDSLAEGEHPRQELYDRYAKMYASMRFKRTYKRVGKSLYEADVRGLGKDGIKEAFMQALRVLTDNYKEEGPTGQQMVCRMPATMEHCLWNLFVYPSGNGYQYSWQEIANEGEPDEEIYDYSSGQADSIEDLSRKIFYTDGTAWYDFESIWVDA